jgi:hypothetical protein
MTTSLSFRLCGAAFVVLTLPMVSRCAGQEAGVSRAGVRNAADQAQRVADRWASVRVLAAEVRAVLVVLRDPDEAYAHLADALAAIRSDPQLSKPSRERLTSRLEWGLCGIVQSGPLIHQCHLYWLVFKAECRERFQFWRFEPE